MVVGDDWVRAAMADSALVADLLTRLKDARPRAAPISAAVAAAELPPPRWGIRQPRTRLAFRCDTASPVKGGGDSRRNSPTTPLSWSAGTASSSGTADCYEESDLPACGSSRSKVFAPNDPTSPLNKKLKRKKTFAELKEEESLLLKERIHLSKELATLSTTFKDERARNESLKRIKLDYNTHTHTPKSIARPAHEQPRKAARVSPSRISMPPHQVAPHNNYPSSDVSREPPIPVEKPKPAATSFVLPDLNLMPSEDDFCL